MTEKALPHRTTGGSGLEEEAVPDYDLSNTAGLLQERLQAWKHAVGYLEDYISATEKVEKAHAKEYEKILKTVSDPLKQGHHFDQKLGGIAGLFENIRSNTQGIANSHLETEKNLKGSVLPILGRLHTEIKHKAKELSSSSAKDSKHVDKARNLTQKHIELLGQHSAGATSSGGKVDAHNDPYVLQRGIRYRLHKQILEENNSRNDLLAVQDSFQQFEAHVIRTIQQAMAAFYQNVGGQADRQKAMYTDMITTTQNIPPDFEWKGFVHRNGTWLIDPSFPERHVSNITYPNQDHPSTQPIIAGTLERKSRAAIKGYSSGYFAVTPSKFLHEFKDNDDFQHDPTPDLSLHLPDCAVGALDGNEFHVKGKDVSKGKIASVLALSHEHEFRAPNPEAAQRWWSILHGMAGIVADPAGSVPTSPVDGRNVSGQHPPPQYDEHRNVTPVQTQGLPQQHAGPTSGTISATDGYGGGSVPSSATATNNPYTTPATAGAYGGPDGTTTVTGALPPKS